MNKNITFVHQLKGSATYRYRAAMPAAEVSKINGYTAKVNEGAADIIVFSKPLPTDVTMAEAAKAEGCKIVVDLTDDHFRKEPIAKMYRAITHYADAIVCPTQTMRERIHAELGKDSAVIPEPYEFEERAPHAEGDKFLWFGNKQNLRGLAVWHQYIRNLDLAVVSGENDIWPDYIEWSLESLAEQLAVRNIVLLPTMKGHEYKSSNRLVNAIRSGCFAVCQGHPAYEEFKRFVWVGNFATGIRWSRHFVADLNALVKAGQDYIRDRYSPETIGKQWASLFDSI